MLTEMTDAITGADAVSFDVFDTLFVRPLSAPEDVFDLLGHRFGVPRFRRLREEAQAEAFHCMQQAGRQEITLNGIYECLAPVAVPAMVLRDAEYAMELALTRPNPELAALFRDCVAAKPVVITSDMYLPRRFFAELLRRHGLPEVPLFISADRDATKRDRGALFDLVAADLGLPPERILHIGDNPRSDVDQARARGLQAVHYQTSRRPTRHGPATPFASMARGLVRIADPVPQPKTFYDLGYRYGGPAAVAFLDWIARQAGPDGIDHVLFISRDGFVLDRLARTLPPGLLPPSDYFRGSRVSFMMAATDQDNYAVQLEQFLAGAEGLAPLEVLERIGVTPPSDAVMRDLGLGDEVVIDPSLRPRMRAFLQAYRPEILKVCRRNRACLFQYLLSLGLRPGMRVALVDVGWRGTTQSALVQALARMLPIDVVGYYLCLVPAAEPALAGTCRALLSPRSLSTEQLERVYANRVAVELMFSAPHHSVIGYETAPDGGILSVEDGGRREAPELARISTEIIRGIEDFAAAYTGLCRDLDLRPDPAELAGILTDFVGNIGEETLQLFATVKDFDTWAGCRKAERSLRDYLAA